MSQPFSSKPKDPLAPWLKFWDLVPDGERIITHTSQLLSVQSRQNGEALMLKVTHNFDERLGAELMKWWNGNGAAMVIGYHGDALLMARANGKSSLLRMATNGEDDEASRIICRVVAKLHSTTGAPPAALVPLPQWFVPLFQVTVTDPIYLACQNVAAELLFAPQDEVALHGDVHHGNILDFGAHGWLAIDPKGLKGERGYDYANLFCNPELSTAVNQNRFLRQLDVVTQVANIDKTRLLQWIMAYAGLSASWFIEDDDTISAEKAIAVARLAWQELGKNPSKRNNL